MTTQKRYDYQVAGKSYTDFPKQSRPLQGQSEHIGNISLLYKNPKNGLDVQLAYVYTGERLAVVNPYINLDYWQNATSQLDFSIEKKITKGFTVYAKINNLLNARYTLFQKKSYNEFLKLNPNSPLTNQSEPDKKLIVQDDYYRATYLIGFRYKL